LVPHIIVWNVHPEREETGFTDKVFGLPYAPGFWRSLWLFLTRSRNAFVKVAQPVNLLEFVGTRLDQGPTALAQSLRKELTRSLSLEVFDVSGPRLRPHKEFIKEILADETIQDYIEHQAPKDSPVYTTLEKHASDLLFEIAAEPKIRWPLTLNRVLNWLWRRMYEGIVVADEDSKTFAAQFEKLR